MFVVLDPSENLQRGGLRVIRPLILSLIAISVAPIFVSHAQNLRAPVKLTNVSSLTSGAGTEVSIIANGTLSKAQTWHDDYGYHVVLPDTVAPDSMRKARGVRIRRVGTSVEFILETKRGARVSLQPDGNRLYLAVDSALENSPFDSVSRSERELSDQRPFESPISSPASEASTQPSLPNAQHPVGVSRSVMTENEGALASVFSGTSALVTLALGLIALLVSKKLRSRQAPANAIAVSDGGSEETESQNTEMTSASRAGTNTALVGTGDSALYGAARQSVARLPVAGPASLYGAYRIGQEVGKLMLGQPHGIDVLASRSIDDRRAIETSLIKGVNSTELEESSRRRAREALEEYGFVARECAALLLAPDAFDRCSAARSLGEIKSAAALPFLLESLYDSESIVRNQAVVSIGELKLPSAIGALLDIARTHPDVPSVLLSRTLSACSVEGLDFFDAVVPEPALLDAGEVGSVLEEITHLKPGSAVESLPEGSDDERLGQALSSLKSIDVDERSEALKTLIQFRVQSAVNAIAQVALHDSEPGIRSQAIACLGSIDHESVFITVLGGMADEAREVRAAAARSLNRLSFDRADAYVRVIETGDDETISNAARACIQSGIVSQNLDRLTDSDYRQAYETFSLICLLANARMNEPLLDAISAHPRNDVRLKLVHLLAHTCHPDAFNQLRELAVTDGVSEPVKTALLEAMYKLDQAKTVAEGTVEGPFLVNSGPQDVREGSFLVNNELEESHERPFLVNGEVLESLEKSLDDENQVEALTLQPLDFKFETVVESQDQAETDNRAQ